MVGVEASCALLLALAAHNGGLLRHAGILRPAACNPPRSPRGTRSARSCAARIARAHARAARRTPAAGEALALVSGLCLDRSVQRRDGVIGTKRVSLEVVAELFDWLVRAWVSSRNMKISASIVVPLGALSPATSGMRVDAPRRASATSLGAVAHRRCEFFEVGQVAARGNELLALGGEHAARKCPQRSSQTEKARGITIPMAIAQISKRRSMAPRYAEG